MPATLPKEVIHQIISFSRYDQATLASCCLVSRTFNEISTPILWGWFAINLTSLNRTKENEEDIPQYNENRFKYVKVAILESDHDDLCRSKALDLPNLIALRLNLSKHPEGLRPTPDFFTPSGAEMPDIPCTPIKNLKPKIVIFEETHKPPAYLSLIFVNPSVWSSSKTWIFNISPFGISDHEILTVVQQTNLSPKLQNIYLMYDPNTPYNKVDSSTENYGGDDHHNLYVFLMKKPNRTITFVNSGITNLRCQLSHRSSIQDTQDSFREAFMKGYFDAVEGARFDSEEDYSSEINFITMEEFMRTEVCWEAFLPIEMESLVKINQKTDKEIEDKKNKKGKKSNKETVKNKDKKKVDEKKK